MLSPLFVRRMRAGARFLLFKRVPVQLSNPPPPCVRVTVCGLVCFFLPSPPLRPLPRTLPLYQSRGRRYSALPVRAVHLSGLTARFSLPQSHTESPDRGRRRKAAGGRGGGKKGARWLVKRGERCKEEGGARGVPCLSPDFGVNPLARLLALPGAGPGVSMPRAFLVKKANVSPGKRNWSEVSDHERGDVYIPGESMAP